MPYLRRALDYRHFLLFFRFFTSLQICGHSGKFIKFYFAVDEIPPSHVLTLRWRFKAEGKNSPVPMVTYKS